MAAPRAVVGATAQGPEERARRVAGPVLGHWRYLDEARTHEVDAWFLRQDEGFSFVIREAAFGAPEGDEGLATTFLLREAWEARFHQADLEGRLAASGAYWRLDAGAAGWIPVRRPVSLPPIDLRPLAVGGAALHLFHDSRSTRDRLLVSLPGASAARFRVADLRFRFPLVEEGRLDVLHPNLPAPLARSLLAREHAAMAAQGFEKLVNPRDLAMALGADWQSLSQQVLHGVLQRLQEGRLGDSGAPPSAPEDSVITPYEAVLKDPRLGAVHRRYLRPTEEATLLQGSDVLIRRAIQQKRRTVSHDEQHLLTVLEASLLTRQAFRAGHDVPPEAARVMRRLDYYL